jgi:hypothetical protein
MNEYTDTTDELGMHVRKKYSQAFNHRKNSGVTDTLLDCLALVRGEDLGASCGIDPMSEGDAMDVPSITLNVVRPIIRGCVAMMKKPLANSKEKPWELRSTPKPELDEGSQKAVKDTLMSSLGSLVQIGVDNPEQVPMLADQLHEALLLEQQKKAALAAEQLTPKLADKLQEAGWTDFFMYFLRHLCMYPYAIGKIENRSVPTRRFVNGKLTFRNEVRKVLANVSPFDFYWMEGSTTVADGEAVIERKRLNRIDMIRLRDVAGYDKDAIDKLLSIKKNGVVEPVTDAETSQDGDDEEGTSGMYDLLGYFGFVPGELLKGRADGIDENAIYEVELWCCADICLFAYLHTEEGYQRPFMKASFEEIPDEFVGECPTTDVKSTQLMINACARALVRNMGMSSGPIGEVEDERVVDDDAPEVLIPGTMRIVKKDKSHAKSAYTFHTVPSISNELMGLLKSFVEYSYEVLGIPRMAFGSPTGLGTVGRTSGGVSMLMNQASNSIYDALESVERHVVQPIVQHFLEELAVSDPDANIGDVNVFPVGLSGLVERETRSDKLQWALQSLAPYMAITTPDGQPIIPPDAPLRLLYKLFKDSGVPTQGLFPDYDLQSTLQNFGSGTANQTAGPVNGAPPPLPQGKGAPSPIPTAPLDGRSGAAAGAIDNMNGGGIPGA